MFLDVFSSIEQGQWHEMGKLQCIFHHLYLVHLYGEITRSKIFQDLRII